MPSLLEMAQAIRQVAGWSRPPEDKDGSVDFHLNSGVSFRLVSHGPRLAAFMADLGPWPDDELEADKLARRLATLAAGSFNRRRSIVSITSGRRSLHLAFDPNQTERNAVPSLCADFLNDLDWWRLNGDNY